uniref:Isocitrate dehydrogenase (NADP(+)) n=1 Tax=Phaeomonas parva TaxID=124430 RepID=A0A7S1U1E5_9STRA|mmetsp:Transcript_27004/g.84917  ORF Transcript_27004/g.84917 Transcript_27004/m.84917 type:complete len:582 (+) Transcript_27004:151-1896(+)
MGNWSKASRTHVAHMTDGDFYGNEQSAIVGEDTAVSITLTGANGEAQVLKSGLDLLAGEVIDSTFMSVNKLKAFMEAEIEDAKETEMLLSLHLKATMMKVSDPIMFGHAVKVFFKTAFEKHGQLLADIGANPNDGLGAVYSTIKDKLVPGRADEVIADFEACYEERPWLAMVNSDKGITNLHVPSDVIIDASMPVVVRDGGMMWNEDGRLEDTKCIIPDRCYATMYQAVFSYCKENGQFDVSTMGNVSNVGLMAKKAEEYGSHDKTFEIPMDGTVTVTDDKTGQVYFEHNVETGDIWRMCQTKDVAIRDWVKLAVTRARVTGSKAIFWLDEKRAHDASLIGLVNEYLQDHDTDGLDISIMRPIDAIRVSMERATNGEDSISVTGNVLRDYLTDLFPILELGTSAKMLSVVPLLAGGGLFETGAGGSAPKHVQQFVEEGHLRWDSLGEYLATAAAFEHLALTASDPDVQTGAQALGEGLNAAVGRMLERSKSPRRKVNELDNRASNYYLALYWAEFMAEKDPAYAALAQELSSSRSAIVDELKHSQGEEIDLGGYYKVDPAKASQSMRPSATFNAILDKYSA